MGAVSEGSPPTVRRELWLLRSGRELRRNRRFQGPPIHPRNVTSGVTPQQARHTRTGEKGLLVSAVSHFPSEGGFSRRLRR